MLDNTRWERTCQECGFKAYPLAPKNGEEHSDRWREAICPKCKSTGFDLGSEYRPRIDVEDDDES